MVLFGCRLLTIYPCTYKILVFSKREEIITVISQICAIAIFLLMFGVIISGKVERHIPTLIGAALMIVVVFLLCMGSPSAAIETLNVHSIFTPEFWYPGANATESSTGINWTTIIFIAGMMVMVEGMECAGFFRWLCLRLAKAVHYKVGPLFLVFMIVSAVLAMFIDSITVILFLASVTIELARLLKFDPAPNIIVGTSLGLTFGDFISNTGLIALIALVFVVPLFYLMSLKTIRESEARQTGDVTYPVPREAIKSPRAFACSTVIFLVAIVLLVTHATTGLSVASIGVIAAGLTLLTAPKQTGYIMKKLDWLTLLFFIGLFVVVGGLEKTGVLKLLATLISSISGGHIVAVLMIILWLSALASAFVDNIPFAATMVPVIKALSAAQGFDLNTLAWALSLGTDIGGNGTPIGASANVVGTSVSAKQGHPIGWGKYCKYCVPGTLLVVAISLGCMLLRYF